MKDKSPVIEKLRSRIGKDEFTTVYEIEKGTIRRMNYAVGDANPLWDDEAFAKKHRFGSIIASPPLMIALGWDEFEAQFQKFMPYTAGVHGSTEIELYKPVRPGDTITIKCKLIDVYEKEGKVFGNMAFLVFERVYTNQKNEVVAKCRQTQISFPSREEQNA